MPSSRFQKLAPDKRERLMDVAAKEFAACGFEDASVNRILDRAQMSKGAAYYYFEDKADLFFTVVQFCSESLKLIDQDVDVSSLTATTFWPTFAELHRRPLVRSLEKPWLFAALHAAGRLAPDTLKREPLATLARHLMGWVMEIVQRGQQVGVIRTDLPDELIFAWLEALDGSGDRWLLAHWERLKHEDIVRISDQTVDAMRRVLLPINA